MTSEAGRRRVVIAPDKFKGSATAQEVAAAMWGAVSARPDLLATSVPVADGGDGSVAAALDAGWHRLRLRTRDAWGAPIEVDAAESDGRVIVEVASICGLGALRPTAADAAAATTVGVGIVLRELLDAGVRDVVVGLGGSATTDAGTGMLSALGARFLDRDGRMVALGATGLSEVERVDLSALHPALDSTRLTFACDVDTPMVGDDGSAEVFAAQKGADAATTASLSAGLRAVARVVGPVFGRPEAHLDDGSGAAGGLGWAGLLLGGRIVSGANLFLDLLGAEAHVRGAALVITGEGRLDDQSLRGKAPVAMATAAARHGVPVVAVVGSSRPLGARSPFAEVLAIDTLDPTCVDDSDLTRRLVRVATARLVDRHLPLTSTPNGAPA